MPRELTLLLLRHVKSSWDDPGLEDFDRPLARRGIEAAPRMGACIAANGWSPDLVLCSGAVRTRETLAHLLPALAAPPGAIVYDDALYLATASDIVARIRAIATSPRTVLVVGHNPGLHSAALSLAGDGSRKDIAAMASKFPTGALAVLGFPGPRWSDLRPASAHLRRFVTPKTLPAPSA